MLRDHRGSVTVFLSLCLLFMAALLLASLEPAAMNGSRLFYQTALNTAADSIQSAYHRGLWEDYRILARETPVPEELCREAEETLTAYTSVKNLYRVLPGQVTGSDLHYLTDGDGEELAAQIRAYMKYREIRDLLIPPEEGEGIIRDLQEGEAVNRVASAYQAEAEEIDGMEEACEALLSNVSGQEETAGAIREALEADDYQTFGQLARQYAKFAGQYPDCLRRCEAAWEQTEGKRAVSRTVLEENAGACQEGRETTLAEAWDPADHWREEEKQLLALYREHRDKVRENGSLLEETAEEVDRLVEAWEDSEDDEGNHDPLSLSSAAGMWAAYRKPVFSFTLRSKDTEKAGLLRQAAGLLEGSILKLVWPAGEEISQAALRDTASFLAGASRTDPAAAPEGEEHTDFLNGEEDPLTAVTDRIFTAEYAGSFFDRALQPGDHVLQYEQEYLLAGEASDPENLQEALTLLFAVRSGSNLLYLMTDTEKQEEAELLAAAVTGLAGAAPLAGVVRNLILVVWAGGESVQDLRTLLSGGRIPAVKTADSWQLSLEGLLQLGKQAGESRTGTEGIPTGEEGKDGFSYGSWLKLLLLPRSQEVLRDRILILIRNNIGVREPSFRPDESLTGMTLEAHTEGRHIFFALPLLQNRKEGLPGSFPVAAKAVFHY